MEKDKKKTLFLKQPEFQGGPKAMTKFIYENLRYPKAAYEANIEGTVYLEYDIDYKGNVVEVRVLRGLGYGCDEEATRVIRMLKFDVDRPRGLKVLFHKKTTVQFKKAPQPKQEEAPAQGLPNQMQISYSYIPAEAQPKPEEAPKQTYTYQIYT
jgi:TonB family protein